jgi:hypothetical protein
MIGQTPPCEAARIGMIHQPHFLPWPGYIARCLAADVVVLLDTVLYKKGYFHNRTRYVTLDGRQVWLTLPLASATRPGPLSDVRLAPDLILKKWQRRFVESYRHNSCFDQLWPAFFSGIDQARPRLVDINVFCLTHLLALIADALEKPSPRVIRASALDLSNDRTERLVDIIAHTGMTHLLMGRDALIAHDLARLEATGVQLMHHVHVSQVPGLSETSVVPLAGITALHYVLVDGIEAAATAFTEDWQYIPYGANSARTIERT